MKKVGDLFEELGFRKDGPESVKRAFVENLVKAAAQTALPRADQTKAAIPTPPTKKVEEQLSFDFGPETPFPTTLKRNVG